MFLGTHEYQIDAKNRLRIPAKFRSELGEKFVVARGTNGCLVVFNPEKENLFAKLQSVPMSDLQAQKSVRMIFASASEVENDEQGRFLLPQKLKEIAGIQKNVVLNGMGTWIELWSEDRWKEYNDSCQEDYDSIFSGLVKFGV